MSKAMKLSEHPLAFRACSIRIPMNVAFAQEDGELDTLEGPVRFRTGDAIVTGVQGERWPVSRERFLASYQPVPPTQTGQDGLYGKNPREVWALELDAPIQIELSSQRGVLQGKAGDFVVEYAPGDQAVISHEIFAQTYLRLD